MVVGQKKMARRRMEVADKACRENLLAALSIVEDFLRDEATRNDLKAAVVSVRVSCLAADAAANNYARIAAKADESDEGEDTL